MMSAMPKIIRGIISVRGENINDGDIILHNDPYLGASHSADVAIVVPIFLEGELIGFCGFRDTGDGIDFGWRYAHEHWGKGYATEAATAVLAHGLETLSLEGIFAVSYEANVGSVRVIRKLGFELVERTEDERGALLWHALS